MVLLIPRIFILFIRPCSWKKIYIEPDVSCLMEMPLLFFQPKLRVSIILILELFFILQILREFHNLSCTSPHAGRFLRMFLGPINVRASRKDIQLKVKEEYNGYRVISPLPSSHIVAYPSNCFGIKKLIVCFISGAGSNGPSFSSFPISFTDPTILGLEWMLAGISCSALPGTLILFYIFFRGLCGFAIPMQDSSFSYSGMVIVPLHWLGFEREHLKSQWKRYSSMVISCYLLLLLNLMG